MTLDDFGQILTLPPSDLHRDTFSTVLIKSLIPPSFDSDFIYGRPLILKPESFPHLIYQF